MGSEEDAVPFSITFLPSHRGDLPTTQGIASPSVWRAGVRGRAACDRVRLITGWRLSSYIISDCGVCVNRKKYQFDSVLVCNYGII